jgi:replicative DNA helicase
MNKKKTIPKATKPIIWEYHFRRCHMDLITDIEAEQRIISALLHSENACIEIFTTVDEDDFYRPVNRNVFLLAKSLYGRGVKPTYVEVIKEGIELGFLSDRNNREDLSRIAEQYIDEENTGYWTDRVRQASKGRKAQNLLFRCREEIQQKNINVPEFIRRTGANFMALAMDADSESIDSGREVAALGEKLVAENVEKWRKLQDDAKSQGQQPLEGVSTGLAKLDGLTLGYKPGDLIILGAQTGHGKTAFALNTAMAACVDGKKPLLYVNTEMSKKQIAYRWGAILSQIPLQKIRTGSLTNGELLQVQTCYRMLSESGFYTSYMPNLTPDKLQILARKAKLQYGIELLILDYVGRMEKADPKLQEWQVLSGIVKTQKLLAQNLDIACMVLVQLNEDGSLQGAKQMKNECDLMLKLLPQCPDLKDGEAVQSAQDKHQRKYGKRYEPFNYRLWVDKSRDSESGISIPLVFDLERQVIRQAAEQSWSDIARASE